MRKPILPKKVLAAFKWLRRSPVNCIKLFLASSILFGCGLGGLIWAENSLPSSLKQELIALSAIGVGGIGFFGVILAQINLILYRFDKLGRK